MTNIAAKNDFNCEYKLLYSRELLKSGNEEKASHELLTVSQNVREKISFYARKVLGEQKDDTIDNPPFERAPCLKKIVVIDRYLLNFVKRELKNISIQFEDNEEMAFASFYRLSLFLKKWEVIIDFDEDIYFLVWKILGKTKLNTCSPREFGKNAFWDTKNCYYGISSVKRSKCLILYSQGLKHCCYIEDSSLKLNKTGKELFVKILQSKTHLEIDGDKLFRKKIISDMHNILTIASGQSLIQQVIAINIEDQIKIKINNEGAESIVRFADFEKTKISSCVIGLPGKDLNLVKVHKGHNGEIHPLPYSSTVVLAHELLHVLWKSKFPQLRTQSPNDPKLYPHAEEEAVITGILGKLNIQYPISENEIRKELQLPSRLGHLAFPVPASIFDACQCGFIFYIQEFLSKGVSINSIDNSLEDKQSLLHIVAGSKYFMLFPDNFKKVVDLLISSGADLEAIDSQDQTPLHIAAKQVRSNEPNSEVAYNYLLEKGANPKVENYVCMTPAQYYQINLKTKNSRLDFFSV